MDRLELTASAKRAATDCGAALCGVVAASDLPEHADEIERMLPGAVSVLVMAVPHSLAAISSELNEAAQFDTIHTYDECMRAACGAAKYLQLRGFPSVAVPAFIPLDMGDGKKGMRGEICWRRAGVRAGLGVYGECGLLITRDYGAAVRLVGLVTKAPLVADLPALEDLCDHCGECVSACPVGALSGGGAVDKRLCGNNIFKYGYRFFEKTVKEIADKGETPEDRDLRELWQTLMTGNYYYCFACQARCKKHV